MIEKDEFRDDRTQLGQALSVLCIVVKFCLPSLSHQSVSRSFCQCNFARGLFRPVLPLEYSHSFHNQSDA